MFCRNPVHEPETHCDWGKSRFEPLQHGQQTHWLHACGDTADGSVLRQRAESDLQRRHRKHRAAERNLQSTSIELRPLNMVEFARLRTSPTVPPKRLFCMSPEGDVEVAPNQVMAASALRLRATILPINGGVATSEVRFSFQ
jgi:hypothetical protein